MPTNHDLYNRDFSPREYLRQYYSTGSLAEDDVAIFRALTVWLRQHNRIFDRALEVGCGPTIHHALPLVPYINELHLSDYTPANLAEVRRWIDGRPEAHEWLDHTRGILELEGVPAEADDCRRREDELRSRITALRHLDLLRSRPLEEPDQFDLVTSFFTIECAATNRETWEQAVGSTLSLARHRGGAAFFGTLRKCESYKVFDKTFPAFSIDEDDYARVLPQYGFPLARAEIHAVPIQQWAEEGFTSILIVGAMRD